MLHVQLISIIVFYSLDLFAAENVECWRFSYRDQDRCHCDENNTQVWLGVIGQFVPGHDGDKLDNAGHRQAVDAGHHGQDREQEQWPVCNVAL